MRYLIIMTLLMTNGYADDSQLVCQSIRNNVIKELKKYKEEFEKIKTECDKKQQRQQQHYYNRDEITMYHCKYEQILLGERIKALINSRSIIERACQQARPIY